MRGGDASSWPKRAGLPALAGSKHDSTHSLEAFRHGDSVGRDQASVKHVAHSLG